MNFINLPIVILLFAFIYLSIVYGLLKIAENYQRAENNVNSEQAQEVTRRIKIP